LVKKSFSIKGDNRLGSDVSDLIKPERWPELKIEKTEKSWTEWDIVAEGADHRIDELYAAFKKLAIDRQSFGSIWIDCPCIRSSLYYRHRNSIILVPSCMTFI
jgi:hypothetical protein